MLVFRIINVIPEPNEFFDALNSDSMKIENNNSPCFMTSFVIHISHSVGLSCSNRYF